MKVEHVHYSNLPAVWHIVKPLVDKALTHNVGEIVGSDFLEPLMRQEMNLFVGTNDNGDLIGAMITEEVIHAQKKELYVCTWATVSGQADDECYKTFEEVLILEAQSTGCHFISTECRRGLGKPLIKKLGWKESYIVMTKHI